MPTARGSIKSHGDRFVGTFDIGGSPRHLAIDVKQRNQSLECSNVTLTYTNAENLVEDCRWTGSIGKDDLQMDLAGGDVSITAPLATPRQASLPIRGTCIWIMGAVELLNQSSHSSTSGAPPVVNSLDVPKDDKTLERERRLLESGAPIIACVLVQISLLHSLLAVLTGLQYFWTVRNGKVDCTLWQSGVTYRV